MLDEVYREVEGKMKKTCALFQKELAGMRAGRATPALLEKVVVDYYGTPTPITQLCTVTVPEPRLMVVQPWDRSQIAAIEKAIMKSELGITPTSDGTVIRLVLPQLTQERRQELVKQARRWAEEQRVAIRNLRREALETLREFKEEGQITEDDLRRGQEQVQKLTDRYIGEIDRILAAKEKEIMEV
ncbi:MAG: ribosome recycling factor [Firmicutes bacterium]|nr:ribosome recycling factor [Bacillota bacterium]MDI6823486.1 ribosome recycling factor [Bacillota bacterium]MDI7248820.1 ribosome recycling factor [Bacillota bacterium]